MVKAKLYDSEQARSKLAELGINISVITIRYRARVNSVGARMNGRWIFDDDDIAALARTPRAGRPRRGNVQ